MTTPVIMTRTALNRALLEVVRQSTPEEKTALRNALFVQLGLQQQEGTQEAQ